MKKVMIICQCATNKGDRAIAEYLIEQLKLAGDIEITLSTTAPKLWNDLDAVNVMGLGYRNIFPQVHHKQIDRISHHIDSIIYVHLIYPNLVSTRGKHRICRFFSRRFVKEVETSDLVIVTGGHHLTSLRNRNAMFAITYDIGLAFLFSHKMVFWSQTIGPLEFTNQKYERFFANMLTNAQQVYIRDENSRQCVQQLCGGSLGNIRKTYDSVFGFGAQAYPSFAERKKRVGVSIFNGLKKAYETYPAIALILDRFAEEGYAVEFFRMEYDAQEQANIERVISLMRNRKDISIFPFLTSTKRHLEELASCKFFVGYKTHSVIMSLTTATPLLGICYHPKTRDFMADYGMEKYALDDETLSAEAALELVDDLLANGETVHEQMKHKSAKLAECVRQDLRRICNAL